MSAIERTASGSPRGSLAHEHSGAALSPVVGWGVTVTIAGVETPPIYARSATEFDLLIRMWANLAAAVTRLGVPVTIEITPLDEIPGGAA